MKKIKVLRIIARLNIGGPAIHTILLTQGLDRDRFETQLICGNIDKDEGDMLYYALERDIKPIVVPDLRRELNLFNDLAAFKKIYNIIKCERPDIIHTHTAKAGTLGRLAGIFYNMLCCQKNKRVKLIHTFHGHIFEGYFGGFRSRLFIFIEQMLASFTTRIITVSETLKKELISFKISKEDKIEVIPLGLELEKFLEIGLKEAPVLSIGIVGRLVPVKNHRLFLESAARVIKEDDKAQLRFEIIGDGKLRKELEKYVFRLGIGPRINFLGWQKDIVKIYSSLDIVALTSINEGTPLSLIEAMASGKAVVATDVGGVRDLLGDETAPDLENGFKVLERGIIVNPKDEDGFFNALIFIIQNDSLRRELGLRARDFIKNKFSKDRLLRDVDSLYNSVLGLK